MIKYILTLLIIVNILFAQKQNIAVLELEGNGISAVDITGLTNRLRTELFKTNKYNVIERSRMDEILKEQGFQISGCTNTECAIEIGKLIGVQKIVMGSVDKVLDLISVNIRLVDVASGLIEINVIDDCDYCNLMDIMKVTLHNSARKLAGMETDKKVEMQNRIPIQSQMKKIKSPYVSFGLSALYPGLGQFYNKNSLLGVLFAGFHTFIIIAGPITEAIPVEPWAYIWVASWVISPIEATIGTNSYNKNLTNEFQLSLIPKYSKNYIGLSVAYSF